MVKNCLKLNENRVHVTTRLRQIGAGPTRAPLIVQYGQGLGVLREIDQFSYEAQRLLQKMLSFKLREP
jgi:hypothetical protein